MYFSYHADMSEKKLACETSDSTATSLTCQEVNFDQSQVYFTIAAVTATNEYESSPKITYFTLQPVQDFKMEVK